MKADIQYRFATEDDTEILVVHRLSFLEVISGVQSEADMEIVRQSLRKYFPQAIRDKQYYGIVAVVDGEIAGTGGMVVTERPANYSRPNGKMGYILNMYTLPAYRRMGIGASILGQLIDLGKEMQLDVLELHASEEGERLYRKFGFDMHDSPCMVLHT